jgi:hypothetical protein
LSDVDLTHLILLLEIDNEFVLTLDYGLVLVNHFISLFLLALGVSVHSCAHVVQSVQFLVQTCDLIVFDDDKLVQFIDLLLGVSRRSLIALEHSKKTIDTFISCLAQILHYTFAHFDLLLVVF